MAKRQRGTSSSSATENESSIKSLCFNEPGRQNLRSRFVTFFQTFPIRNERIPSIAAINDTNLKFKYLPHLKSWKFINTFKIPPHVYHVLVRTEANLPPHFRVMLDSFDVRLATMQSHFDGRLNEISNQQSVIQTELSEIRRHLNDKFDRLFVVVGNPSHDLSTSKAPTAQ
ncbi:hypothetical protein V6N11_002254 [Hibiscus sabdariffa]|uniref:Uncharacterized protein n=1 Tax=Hibiscus sabdariffa TaxID=183260 RepID=A0ABR2QUV4_9ROSI